jgi:hypothetical protein
MGNLIADGPRTRNDDTGDDFFAIACVDSAVRDLNMNSGRRS